MAVVLVDVQHSSQGDNVPRAAEMKTVPVAPIEQVGVSSHHYKITEGELLERIRAEAQHEGADGKWKHRRRDVKAMRRRYVTPTPLNEGPRITRSPVSEEQWDQFMSNGAVMYREVAKATREAVAEVEPHHPVAPVRKYSPLEIPPQAYLGTSDENPHGTSIRTPTVRMRLRDGFCMFHGGTF